LAQKVSSIFDIDMTEKYTEFFELYKEEVDLLNHSLSKLIDTAIEHLYTEKSLLYVLDITEGCFMFDLGVSEDVDDITKKYSEKFKEMER
jgi:hypothetical protein